MSHAGGLAETKRIAHLAHLHLIPVAPHNPVGPVMNAMTLHTAVAIPNFSVFETVSVDVPWRKELVKETLVFEDGHLLAPTAPGLGVELNEEACARFPYAPHDVPLFDGSINLSGVATGAVVMNTDPTLAQGDCPDARRPHPQRRQSERGWRHVRCSARGDRRGRSFQRLRGRS